ncbi:MAG: hypothetical protein A2Z34_08780 [Planctomycetes bacterium RBG_16_59_8]|nr:MAG: hypothetical protein A2Z34_08780 [Planctomycetes bacterium RBG_16_59_8]
MLPEDLKAQAFATAREMGISLGELIRESLRNALHAKKGLRDPLIADHAVSYRKGPADVAANHDDYLAGGENDLP